MTSGKELVLVPSNPDTVWEQFIIRSVPDRFGESLETVMKRADDYATKMGIYPLGSLATAMLNMADAGRLNVQEFNDQYYIYPQAPVPNQT